MLLSNTVLFLGGDRVTQFFIPTFLNINTKSDAVSMPVTVP
jgi:hypothetical protein